MPNLSPVYAKGQTTELVCSLRFCPVLRPFEEMETKASGSAGWVMNGSICCPPVNVSSSWLYTAFLKPSQRAHSVLEAKGNIPFNSRSMLHSCNRNV